MPISVTFFVAQFILDDNLYVATDCVHGKVSEYGINLDSTAIAVEIWDK